MAQILPAELLQNVFMLLSPCTDYPSILKVCIHWRDVCMDTIELRKKIIFSSFRLQSPLKWCTPKTVQSTLGSPTQTGPSMRFGSSVTVYRDKIYVFGGSTRMFTSFNDLWVFDLRTLKWNRILCEGEPPAPRAHAKGGFINDIFYLFGGCKSFCSPGFYRVGHIEWLTDLHRFDPATCHWSRCQLRHVSDPRLEETVVSAGQSGCFLPNGGPQEPSLLVLFGGSSHVTNVCVNSLCIIAPEQGVWFTIAQPQDSETVKKTTPSGRCGHSVCALDSNRMLVLFGNLQSPMIGKDSSPEQSGQSSAEPVSHDLGGQPKRSLRGKPAGDVWILTRCRPEALQDWSTVCWFWTEVDCLSHVPHSPPLDFYYMSCVALPSAVTPSHSIQEERMTACAVAAATFTVVCVSQATDQLLEEAGRQRRRLLQRLRTNSEVSLLPSPPGTFNSTTFSSPSSPSSSSSCTSSPPSGTSLVSTSSPSAPVPAHSSSEDHGVMMNAVPPLPSWRDCNGILASCDDPHVEPALSSPAATRRTAERRARRLKALEAQERRLFGQRVSSASESAPSAASGEQASHPAGLEPASPPPHPMAVYSLELRLPAGPAEAGQAQGRARASWLPPRRLHYLDLVEGPQECLGASIAYGHGCVFLFGGLVESDEAVVESGVRQPKSGPLTGRTGQASQLFVLQPKSLLGTLV